MYLCFPRNFIQTLKRKKIPISDFYTILYKKTDNLIDILILFQRGFRRQIEKQIFFSKSNIINTYINVVKMKKQNLNYFTRACQ